MIDSVLINFIKKRCDENISFIDEIASVLEINYDAAYRRVNGKTNITLKETIKLSKHFKISLDTLYGFNNADEITITKTPEIKNATDLEIYFLKLAKDLAVLDNDKSSIFYSAKDLPIFYVLRNDLLSKFKLYVWLYILDANVAKNGVSFENFNIPKSLQNAAIQAGNAYSNVKISEMWNYGIINSVINQIHYFFEVKLITYNTATKIIEDLKKTINNIETCSFLGKRKNKKQTVFNLYHNELLTLNNNIIIKYKDQKTLISPYSLLRYYLIEDEESCNKFDAFLKEQVSISKLLSKTGVKERMLFFKPIYQQIKDLADNINFLHQFPMKYLNQFPLKKY